MIKAMDEGTRRKMLFARGTKSIQRENHSSIIARMLSPARFIRAGILTVEFDWLWELDRKLNALAIDAILAVIGAALISESLRFVAERLFG